MNILDNQSGRAHPEYFLIKNLQAGKVSQTSEDSTCGSTKSVQLITFANRPTFLSLISSLMLIVDKNVKVSLKTSLW